MGSGNELVDYSRAPCLGADQKARGLWERDCWARRRRCLRSLITTRHDEDDGYLGCPKVGTSEAGKSLDMSSEHQADYSRSYSLKGRRRLQLLPLLQ